MKNNYHKILYTIFSFFLFVPIFVSASSSVGTIDPQNLGYNKAYLLNNGDLNNISKEINVGKFGLQSNQNVSISGTELTGWMWGSATGWISFNCSNFTNTNPSGTCGSSDYKVSIDADGYLSGYAWGPQSGWVNFAPTAAGVNTVHIEPATGDFYGYAWSSAFGYISFNCANDNSCGALDFKTSTDFVPSNHRTQNKRGSGSYPYSYLPVNKENIPTSSGGLNIDANKKNSKSKTAYKYPNTKPENISSPSTQPPEITKPIGSTGNVQKGDTAVSGVVEKDSFWGRIFRFIKKLISKML